MENLRYYIDEINVIVDGDLPVIVTITVDGIYEPNQVKKYAENMLRQSNPDSRITSVILNHRNVTLEEFRAVTGRNPAWLGNIKNSD